VSILLPGDIGGDAEQPLATRFVPAPVQVVKVPHHGSAGSSSAAFVAATRPDLAVVSAGRANQFGHPAPEVVRRYLDRGARVLNTAADGAITIETDGRTVEVSTMTGRTMTLSPAP
jgi:competence protein ComEC